MKVVGMPLQSPTVQDLLNMGYVLPGIEIDHSDSRRYDYRKQVSANLDLHLRFQYGYLQCLTYMDRNNGLTVQQAYNYTPGRWMRPGRLASAVYREKETGRAIFYRSFKTNGDILETWELNKEGRLHGECVSIHEVGRYSNGRRVGPWVYTDDKGRVIEEVRYRGGLPNGFITYYWPNGKKRARLPVKNGVPEGWAKFWNPDGSYLGRHLMFSGRVTKREITGNPVNAPKLSPIRVYREILDYNRLHWKYVVDEGDLKSYVRYGSKKSKKADFVIDAIDAVANIHPGVSDSE